MPVYNERTRLRVVVERVLAVPQEEELICVDDGSRDESREILAELQGQTLQPAGIATAPEYGEGRGPCDAA